MPRGMENWNDGMVEHWGGNWTVGTTDQGRRDFVLTFLRIGPRAELKQNSTAFRWFEIPLDARTKLVDVGSHVRNLDRHKYGFDALVLFLFVEILLITTFAPTVLRDPGC
jgi:hypothetical protein